MSLKRGNLPQMAKDGQGFIGSGGGDDSVETPRRATAAQMAGRKIKVPRTRTGGSAFPASAPRPPANFAFQQNNPPDSTFQPSGMSGGFSFNASQSSGTPSVQFGQGGSGDSSQNAGGGGYSGSLFSIPSASNQSAGAATTQNGNTPSFNSSSNFGFGGGGSNSNPFGGSNQTSQAIPASNTSNLFAASASSNPFGSSSVSQAPSMFGQTQSTSPNLFGAQTSGTAASNMFASTSPAPESLNLFAQKASGDPPATNKNMFASSTNALGSFGQTTGTTQPTSLFSSNTPPPPQGSNLFGGKSDEGSAKQSQSSLPQSSSLFSFSNPGQKDQATASKPSETKSLFASVSQGGSNNLFSFGQNAGEATATSSGQASSSSSTDNPFAKTRTQETDKTNPPENAQNVVEKSSDGSSNQMQSLFGSAPPSKTSNLFSSAAGAGASAQQAPKPLFGIPSQKPFTETGDTTLDSSSSTSAPAASSLFATKSTAPDQPTTSKNTANATSAAGSTLLAPAQNIFGATTAQNAMQKADGGKWCPNPEDPDGGYWTPGKPKPPSFLNTLGKHQDKGKEDVPSLQDANSRANPFGSSNPGLSTLNASTNPPTTQRSVTSFGGINIPPAPGHFNEEQRAQWPHAYRLRLLTEWFKECVFKPEVENDLVATQRLIQYYQSAVEEIEPFLKKKPASTGKATTLPPSGASLNAPPFGTPAQTTGSTSLFSAASSQKRNSDQLNSGAGDTASSNVAKKQQTGDVSYPQLPAATAQSLAVNKLSAPEPPKFQIPKFGGGSGGGGGGGGANFMAQFGQQAKKAEAEAAQKRKDEDFDSEEDDEEEWEKREAERRAAEHAKIEALSKNKALGFQFSPSSMSGTSAGSLFGTESSTLNKGGAVTTEKASGASLFAKPDSDMVSTTAASSAKSVSASSTGFGAASTQPQAQKPLFSFSSTANNTTPSTNLFGSSSSVIPSGKPLGPNFSFSTSASNTTGGSSIFGNVSAPATDKTTNLGTSLFGSGGTSTQTVGSRGGLFDRVETDKDSTDNTFKGDSSTPIKFSSKMPSSLAPPSVISDTSRATTPATTGDDTDTPAVDDDVAKDEQLDLSTAAVGEEDEDVLVELRAKGSELVKSADGKSEWVVRGVGQLKLLRHRESRKTRVLLRSSPAAKIVLNTRLLPSAKYASTGAKNNSIRVPAVTTDGKINQFVIMVKDSKDAVNLAAMMEENKSN